MTHLVITFCLFVLLAVIISLVLGLVTPEETFRGVLRVALKNLLLITILVFGSGLIAFLIAMFL